MKWIKKCPLVFLTISSFLLLTVLAIGGIGTIYEKQEWNPLKAPLLSVVFTGINEGIYPWQLFKQEVQETAAAGEEEGAPDGQQEETAAKQPSASPAVSPTALPSASPSVTMTPSPTPYDIKNGRLAPLRESTREEYLNHISADIYGDAGVLRAAEYSFEQVNESYFDDALFIGDSRTVGLHDYTDLAEHADFLCETSLTVYKVMEENFKGYGTVEEVLSQKDYGKIYIMVGINELGRGTTEDFMAKYTEVVDSIHGLEPDAKIFIQGIMRVSGKKNDSDAIFNNSNINARNNAIATLADNVQIFYIDVNEVVCDEEGNLSEEYTFDQIHLLGVYNELWKQFLLSHGAEAKETQKQTVSPSAVPETESPEVVPAV